MYRNVFLNRFSTDLLNRICSAKLSVRLLAQVKQNQAAISCLVPSKECKPHSARSHYFVDRISDPLCNMAGKTDISPKKQFYRRVLPEESIEFSSKTGKQIFQEAMASGHMECYFKLASQFRTQDEPAFCGLSTLVMVLNALSVDPGRVWKGPWRWYHESMLDCCTSQDLIKEKGITFDEFICLAECNFLATQPVRGTDNLDVDAFREMVKDCTRQDDTVLVVSYSRKTLNQTGDGHFSPVGGYHPDKDLVLVLDTARFKYPPHWVPLTLLVNAMKELDAESGKPRGYVLLSRQEEFSPLLLFRLSPLLSVTLPQGFTPGVKSFIDRWVEWLMLRVSPGYDEELLITQVVENLLDISPILSQDASILTSCLDVKCPELVSHRHLCAMKQLVHSIENQPAFKIISKNVTLSLLSDSEKKLCKICKAAGIKPKGTTTNVKCCEVKELLSPSHFLTVLLYCWPYDEMAGDLKSNGYNLRKLVQQDLERAPDLLKNDVSALQQQLKTILVLYNRKNPCSCKRKFQELSP